MLRRQAIPGQYRCPLAAPRTEGRGALERPLLISLRWHHYDVSGVNFFLKKIQFSGKKKLKKKVKIQLSHWSLKRLPPFPTYKSTFKFTLLPHQKKSSIHLILTQIYSFSSYFTPLFLSEKIMSSSSTSSNSSSSSDDVAMIYQQLQQGYQFLQNMEEARKKKEDQQPKQDDKFNTSNTLIEIEQAVQYNCSTTTLPSIRSTTRPCFAADFACRSSCSCESCKSWKLTTPISSNDKMLLGRMVSQPFRSAPPLYVNSGKAVRQTTSTSTCAWRRQLR